MYVLKIRDTKTDQVSELTFETRELAVLYRDYHLAFGNWNNRSRWIDESLITPEESKFIFDEMSEMRGGIVVRVYHVGDGIKLELEEAKTGLTLQECWDDLRVKRTQMLVKTDWTQVADVTLGQEERKLYRSYRAYLRNLPKMYSDETIVSAKVYDFTSWLNGKR